jgi:hypothetical protein
VQPIHRPDPASDGPGTRRGPPRRQIQPTRLRNLLFGACYYEIGNQEAEEYAYRCEGEAPARWDDAPAKAGTGDTEEELRRDQIAYLPQLPKCDLRDQTAEYDARTKHGPWAYLCPDHWGSETYGQLGTGYGQKLMVRN